MRQAFCGCASSGIQRPRVASRRLVPLALLSSAHLARTPHTYLVSLAYLHTIHTRTARILTRPPAVASARNHVSKATHTHTHTNTHTHTHARTHTHTKSRERDTPSNLADARSSHERAGRAHAHHPATSLSCAHTKTDTSAPAAPRATRPPSSSSHTNPLHGWWVELLGRRSGPAALRPCGAQIESTMARFACSYSSSVTTPSRSSALSCAIRSGTDRPP